MLVEFKVKNFLSIRDQQTFSLVASSSPELTDNVAPLERDSSLNLVKTAAIYGPNAGGKSNLLNALLFVRRFILTSAKDSMPGEKIPVLRFAFDEVSSKLPSEFEVTFIKDNIRYQYGFVADENRVLDEYLLVYPPKRRMQQWFSRIYDKKNDTYSWKTSNLFKVSKHIKNETLKEMLFLSNAVKSNNQQLLPIFSWFQKDLIFINSPRRNIWGYSGDKAEDRIKSNTEKDRILKFIFPADTSITDIIVENKKYSKEPILNFPDSMPKEVQEYLKSEILKQDNRNQKISFLHAGGFQLDDMRYESEGTLKFFNFAGPWLDALDNGRVIFVDELDNSLHALLARSLIKLLHDPQINKKNAQLIFTTHDTSLLDTDVFRRDQIWFVEKDKNNSTQLYPLSDFSPRKHEAIERGYLQGRYGALPYIGEWRF